MSAYDAAGWQNFYVMVGGAAAALTGLLFVAMSLHAKAIIADPLHGSRAVGTLLSLMTQLFVAGTVLIPQSTMMLGTEVEVAALLSLVQSVRGVVVTLRTAKRRVRSRIRTTLEGIGAAIWIVLFVASGISLIAHAGGGLYLLAAVMPFMFGWNVYVAWVLITEISD
ncbi:MAG TPA: hypothetical protein VG426_02600 [Candidatus Dormibacteraeota bacterium]|jgi:hypothetical protein|nr:hypothetical protein [Candidatus Dormibacteraeota bacterium]